MKVLIVGSGGREHALAWAVSKSPKCDALFCAPGNAGTSDLSENVHIGADDMDDLVTFAQENAIDFVIVGPEAPLVAGLADKLEASGIVVFGPSAAAAELEGSKGFTKDLCARFNIPTADYERFDEPDAAKEYIRKQTAHGKRLVVKADGLAAGKGVIICHNENEAFAAVDHIMVEEAFAGAGAEVVVEEFLEGEEASFFALVDGERAIPMIAAQDHKRAFDGDQGPNTGGMGAYAPAPLVDPAMADRIMNECINPTIKGMASEGRPFKGVLFAGLMIDADGPKLIEHNVRFGDPECQVLMSLLESDFLEALYAAAIGKLDQVDLSWSQKSAMIVVMAAKGYPGSYDKGTEIKGLEQAAKLSDTLIFHAGTAQSEDKVQANGGRVLGVVGLGDDLGAARDAAYKAVDAIDWPEGFCRRDIGWRVLG